MRNEMLEIKNLPNIKNFIVHMYLYIYTFITIYCISKNIKLKNLMEKSLVMI